MNEELRDAIDTACSVGTGPSNLSRPNPRHSRQAIIAIVRAVCEALPPEVTVGDILEDLG